MHLRHAAPLVAILAVGLAAPTAVAACVTPAAAMPGTRRGRA